MKLTKRQKNHVEKTYWNYGFTSQKHVQQKIKFPIHGKRFKMLRFLRTVSEIKRNDRVFMDNNSYWSCFNKGVHYDNRKRKFSITHSFN